MMCETRVQNEIKITALNSLIYELRKEENIDFEMQCAWNALLIAVREKLQ